MKTSFLELLKICPDRRQVIAVVGAGGKTSLIFELTRELADSGKKVIVTTTTHMKYEPDRPFAENGNPDQARKHIDECGYTVAAVLEPPAEQGKIRKIRSLPDERLKQLKDECGVLLIEADGSNRLPLKTPEAWEPAIPEFTDLVIGVIGLDCIGKQIGKISHRPEKTAALLKKSLSDRVTEEDLVKIADSAGGLRKNTEGKVYRVYLNKADTPAAEDAAARICEELASRGVSAVWGSLRKTEKS